MSFFGMILELIGTVSFAISGAVVGMRKNMDLFGVAMLGVITAVGGGVMRDIILGLTPPTAFMEPKYALTATAVSLLIFLPPVRRWLDRQHEGFDRVQLLADSIGLGIFVVCGVRVVMGTEYRNAFFLCLFVAVLTGVGGGVLRDVLAGDRPYIFLKHIYACAAIVGAVVCFFLWPWAGEQISMAVGCVLILLIRLCSARFHWNLPRA